MVILCMAQYKTSPFIRNQNHFSIMLPQQLQVPYGELPEKSSNQKLFSESLQLRRQYRALCCFVKIYHSKSSGYFLIPTLNRSQPTRNFHNISQFKVKHNFFENLCDRYFMFILYLLKFISIFVSMKIFTFWLTISHRYIVNIYVPGNYAIFFHFYVCKFC